MAGSGGSGELPAAGALEVPESTSVRDFDVVVYGASGCTGRLVVEYLTQHAEVARERWAIAGRCGEKLARVREALVGGGCEVIVARSESAEQLQRMTRRARVLVNAAGPYARCGAKIIESCLATQTHYCDVSGEVVWLRRMLQKYQAEARQRGILVVPMAGLEAVPADIGAHLLRQHVRALRGGGDGSASDNGDGEDDDDDENALESVAAYMTTSYGFLRAFWNMTHGTVESLKAAVKTDAAELVRATRNPRYLCVPPRLAAAAGFTANGNGHSQSHQSLSTLAEGGGSPKLSPPSPGSPATRHGSGASASQSHFPPASPLGKAAAGSGSAYLKHLGHNRAVSPTTCIGGLKPRGEAMKRGHASMASLQSSGEAATAGSIGGASSHRTSHTAATHPQPAPAAPTPPEPLGVRYSCDRHRWLTPWLGNVNAKVVQRSMHIDHLERVAAGRVGVAPHAYTEAWTHATLFHAAVTLVGMYVFSLIVLLPPLRWLASWVLLPRPGGGPSRSHLHGASLHIDFVGVTAGGDTHTVGFTIRCDPAYKGSAVMCAETALLLAARPVAAGGGGFRTPATVDPDALVSRLRRAEGGRLFHITACGCGWDGDGGD